MYMPLLGAGENSWRPVEVTPLEGAFYRVEGPMPVDETWTFVPGTLVTVEWRRFGGEDRLVPVGEASSSVSAALNHHYKRMAGLLLTTVTWFGLTSWLPRAPEGHFELVPFFIINAMLALAAIAGMIWWKPSSVTWRWALSTALILSVVMIFTIPAFF
jgi:hypothetical protein